MEAKKYAHALVKASENAISAALEAQINQLEKEYGELKVRREERTALIDGKEMSDGEMTSR